MYKSIREMTNEEIKDLGYCTLKLFWKEQSNLDDVIKAVITDAIPNVRIELEDITYDDLALMAQRSKKEIIKNKEITVLVKYQLFTGIRNAKKEKYLQTPGRYYALELLLYAGKTYLKFMNNKQARYIERDSSIHSLFVEKPPAVKKERKKKDGSQTIQPVANDS